MIRKVDATVLFVQDLDKMMKFYRDKIGLEIVVTDDVSYAFKMEGQDFALVKEAAGVAMLNEEVFAAQPVGRRVMMCTTVDDVVAVYTTLSARGVTFIKPPMDQVWGWRTAYLADPEDNIWEFRQSI